MNKKLPSISHWIELEIALFSGEILELLSNFLFELGAIGLQETENGVKVYFPSKYSQEFLKKKLKQYLVFLDPSEPVFQFRIVASQNWAEGWKSHFKPIRIGKRIVVKPPWQTWIPSCDRIVIDIVPKMAFGTGTHETTQLCIELLEQWLQSGTKVLDIGTGSGILAIAAVKLGAKKVDAIDIEKEAVENAKENARLNSVENKIKIYLSSLENLPYKPYDLILANLDLKTILHLLPELHHYAKPSTAVILSGILKEEKTFVLNKLKSTPFQSIQSKTKKEWIAIVAQWRKIT